MDYIGVGKRIQYIRKKKLKMNREEFADLLNTNATSLGRLERGEIKTVDIAIIEKVSLESGYSIDEIVYGFLDTNKNTFIKKINYLLNGLEEKELQYHFDNIRNLTKLYYSGDTRTLKDIKQDINQK